MAVSIERSLAIRSPCSISPITWKTSRFIGIITSILVATFVLTFFHNFWYTSVLKPECANQTKILVYEFTPSTLCGSVSETMKTYLNVSVVLGTVLIILLPFAAMIFLNILLVNHLRSHRKSLNALVSRKSRNSRTSSATSSQQEARATFVVCVIVGSFLFFNALSAILHLLSFCQADLFRYHGHKIVVAISNSLITTAKSVNFILFCMSSRHFRKKAWMVISRSRKHSSESFMTSHFSGVTGMRRRKNGNEMDTLTLQERPLLEETSYNRAYSRCENHNVCAEQSWTFV